MKDGGNTEGSFSPQLFSVKECFKCGKTKPLTDFYKHPAMTGGRLNKCKMCTKNDVRLNRLKRINYYKRYDSERFKRSGQRWKNYHPSKDRLKTKARQIISNALRDGKMIRLPCIVCGDSRSQAHHEDYSKPMDVIWLCANHHGMVHRTYDPLIITGKDKDDGNDSNLKTE